MNSVLLNCIFTLIPSSVSDNEDFPSVLVMVGNVRCVKRKEMSWTVIQRWPF